MTKNSGKKPCHFLGHSLKSGPETQDPETRDPRPRDSGILRHGTLKLGL